MDVIWTYYKGRTIYDAPFIVKESLSTSYIVNSR